MIQNYNDLLAANKAITEAVKAAKAEFKAEFSTPTKAHKMLLASITAITDKSIVKFVKSLALSEILAAAPCHTEDGKCGMWRKATADEEPTKYRTASDGSQIGIVCVPREKFSAVMLLGWALSAYKKAEYAKNKTTYEEIKAESATK